MKPDLVTYPSNPTYTFIVLELIDRGTQEILDSKNDEFPKFYNFIDERPNSFTNGKIYIIRFHLVGTLLLDYWKKVC